MNQNATTRENLESVKISTRPLRGSSNPTEVQRLWESFEDRLRAMGLRPLASAAKSSRRRPLLRHRGGARRAPRRPAQRRPSSTRSRRRGSPKSSSGPPGPPHTGRADDEPKRLRTRLVSALLLACGSFRRNWRGVHRLACLRCDELVDAFLDADFWTALERPRRRRRLRWPRRWR
jgi:hypothetical protein